VGNALTQANPDLNPEKSLGVEGSALWRTGAATLRAAAFSTHLTGGIVNVTLQSSPALILRQRQNAASIARAGSKSRRTPG
jgi:outer membrane cobalamin receptor